MTGTDDRAPEAGDRRRAVADLEAAFSQLMVEFRRLYAQMSVAAAPGMLPATFKTLAFINRLGPITQSALAERLPADKGLVSRQVSELESLGMVARTPDPEDARVRHIEVTPFGRERLAAARGPYERMLTDALADWPLSEIDRLTSLLHALADGFVPGADARSGGDSAS
ncbi:MarR family winged helix-turn-helix transcriptional regulator [Microbacterium sp. GXF7504]